MIQIDKVCQTLWQYTQKSAKWLKKYAKSWESLLKLRKYINSW